MRETILSLYISITSTLQENEIESAEIESRQILIKALGYNSYTDLLLNLYSTVDDDTINAALKMVSERIAKRPIQYIIGEWDFLDNTYKVGEGVLIPRPETEQLCEVAFQLTANKKNPVIYDLCSGSGCIGISMKKEFPGGTVYLIEKSPEAFYYTRLNSERICGADANILINADIFNYSEFEPLPSADIILSNPPYIKSDEIATLQAEVLIEPEMALDGGADGLVFYRVICDFWSAKLKDDGIIVLECGEDQAEDIISIFSAKGFFAESVKDFNNIERIIVVRRIKC